MEKIVFLDRQGLQVPLRPPCFPHEWQDYPDTPTEQLVERLRGASIAITDRVPIPKEALEQLPDLKFIAVAATGFDGIDVDTCRQQGVTVSNVRDWALSVPEHVFSLILALRRNLLAYHSAVQAGAWQNSPGYMVQLDPTPQALYGGTLGIIGHGALGWEVARLGECFGMKVRIAERKGAERVRAGRTAFTDVLVTSDVLVILCPLNDETLGMIGAEELALMQRRALLINCARGGIVDEAALADALIHGELAGAGLDVLSQEPPLNGSPLLGLNLPNLIVTPHVAWVSEPSLRALADQVIDNIEAFHSGHPRNLVI